MKKIIFNFAYIVAIVIYLIGELHSPWLLLVFLSGTLVKYRLTKDFIEPLDKASRSPHAWLYEHGRLWAKGLHKPLDPYKCPDCPL